MEEDLKIPRDADKWREKYKQLRFNKERRAVFVNATLEADIPEKFWDEIDVYDVMISTFRYLVSRGTGGAAEFLEGFRTKKPTSYEKSRHWYDYELIDYYASLNERERISSLITTFINDPEKEIEILFHVLDTLRLYDYGEETRKLSIAAYNKLQNSTEILHWGLVELEETAISSFLEKHLIAGNAETDEIILEMEDNGLHPKREAIDAALGIFNGFAREWTQSDFRKSKKGFHFNLFLLLTEFTHHMGVRHSVYFTTSGLFAWLLRDFYYSLCRRHKGKFVFSFPREHLSWCLRGYFDILSMSQMRGMALLPALKYFSNFLYEKGLVTPAELEEIEENVEEVKELLRKVCVKEPWRYKFLLQWKLDGKQLYSEDYFNTDSLAAVKKVGRNDPCSCGSGKKYKKCCGGCKK